MILLGKWKERFSWFKKLAIKAAELYVRYKTGTLYKKKF